MTSEKRAQKFHANDAHGPCGRAERKFGPTNQKTSTTQIWIVTCHQNEISALVSQTSFRGETIGSVAKCRLLSQTSLPRKG